MESITGKNVQNVKDVKSEIIKQIENKELKKSEEEPKKLEEE
ncbi:2125_t:CDS:1, partial [Gigaspora rosea]